MVVANISVKIKNVGILAAMKPRLTPTFVLTMNVSVNPQAIPTAVFQLLA